MHLTTVAVLENTWNTKNMKNMEYQYMDSTRKYMEHQAVRDLH